MEHWQRNPGAYRWYSETEIPGPSSHDRSKKSRLADHGNIAGHRGRQDSGPTIDHGKEPLVSVPCPDTSRVSDMYLPPPHQPVVQSQARDLGRRHSEQMSTSTYRDMTSSARSRKGTDHSA